MNVKPFKTPDTIPESRGECIKGEKERNKSKMKVLTSRRREQLEREESTREKRPEEEKRGALGNSTTSLRYEEEEEQKREESLGSNWRDLEFGEKEK